MHVVLPLTKGQLCNKDKISWQKGCSDKRGTTVLNISNLSKVWVMVYMYIMLDREFVSSHMCC